MEAVGFPTGKESILSDTTEFAYLYQLPTLSKETHTAQRQGAGLESAEGCTMIFSVAHVGLTLLDFSSWGSTVLLNFSGFQFPCL